MRGFSVIFVAAAAGIGIAAQNIQIKVENRVALWDAPPTWSNGTAMVPIRSMIDTMDGTMKWNMGTRTVTCWRGSHKVDFVLNSRTAKVDGKEVMMEESTFIQKGRIFVPLRFVADAAGYSISEENGWFVLKPITK